MITWRNVAQISGSLICCVTLVSASARPVAAAPNYQRFAQAPSVPAVDGQPSVEAAKTESTYSVEDLSYLLAPIALFPDPLIALVLGASTYPVQVVEAHEWIKSNPRAVAARDFSQVDAKPWESSIQALTRFPEQIAMLADHLDWTQSLGTAFAFQQQDVTNVIQMLRAKAESAGNLKSTPQQKVEVRETAGARTILHRAHKPGTHLCACLRFVRRFRHVRSRRTHLRDWSHRGLRVE